MVLSKAPHVNTQKFPRSTPTLSILDKRYSPVFVKVLTYTHHTHTQTTTHASERPEWVAAIANRDFG